MGQPKIWNDSGIISRADNNLNEGDLKVVGTSQPYKLQIRQGGAWVDFLAQSTLKLRQKTKVLTADVVSNATANVLSDLIEFRIAMFTINPSIVHFRATIIYAAAEITTGSRWSVSAPPGTYYSYRSSYPLSATAETLNHCSGGKQPSAANASSLSTTANIALLEGFAMTPGEDGNLDFVFASGVNNSAITAKAGSLLVYEEYRASDYV